MIRRLLVLAALLLAPLSLSGCYVGPAPGYYARPYYGGYYARPYYGGYYARPYYARPYSYGGWGYRRW